MKFLGMLGVPIVGTVGPDGVVEFDPKYIEARKDEYRRCNQCGKSFRLKSKYDPMLVCDPCMSGR